MGTVGILIAVEEPLQYCWGIPFSNVENVPCCEKYLEHWRRKTFSTVNDFQFYRGIHQFCGRYSYSVLLRVTISTLEDVLKIWINQGLYSILYYIYYYYKYYILFNFLPLKGTEATGGESIPDSRKYRRGSKSRRKSGFEEDDLRVVCRDLAPADHEGWLFKKCKKKALFTIKAFRIACVYKLVWISCS